MKLPGLIVIFFVLGVYQDKPEEVVYVRDNVTITFSMADAKAELQRRVDMKKNNSGMPLDPEGHKAYLNWLEHCLDKYDNGLVLYADSVYSTIMDTVDSYTAYKQKWPVDTIVSMPDPKDERHLLQEELYWISYELLKQNKAVVKDRTTRLTETSIMHKEIKSVGGKYTEFKFKNEEVFWRVWTVLY